VTSEPGGLQLRRLGAVVADAPVWGSWGEVAGLAKDRHEFASE
jgi:hypothetical protein